MTRPVDTWDFISKVHDLLYEVNGLTVWRLGDAKYRSRMSKADYIMRVLHKEESSRSFYGPGMRALFGSSSWPGRLGRRCAATWFKENDGFVNVLRRDGLPELPDKFDRDNDYASLMIPRDALPAPDIGHARKWVSVTTVFHDSDYFVRPEEIEYRLVPSYLVPTDYDYTKDWREWGKEHFGNLWAIAESVTAAVSSLDAGN